MALVVEDSAMMRQLIMFALARIPGMRCTEADDGADALRKLKGQRFDVVLLDINMPMMDGLKLLEVIRKNPTHAAVPVVMLTTEGRPEDIERAMELGATRYLTKPVQAQEVIDVVNEVLAAAG
jgi:two-component system chemotaxis response regulator CheY